MEKEQTIEEKNRSLQEDKPDAENRFSASNKPSQNAKVSRMAGKRPPFVRRPGIRKRSYSYSEGHNTTKRFKRCPKLAGNKFLFGGNIRDPLNLNALTEDRIEAKRNESVLQPKKFDGSAYKGNVIPLPGRGRWKKTPHEKKFLLGGNFRDPLNLNSFSDEKVARLANAVTPQSSPVPTPKHRKAEYKIEVLIPQNISDPLNLMSFDDDDSTLDSLNLISPEGLRKRRYAYKSSNNVTDSGSKKLRFRKRAKSMVDGGFLSGDFQMSFESGSSSLPMKRRRNEEGHEVTEKDVAQGVRDEEKIDKTETIEKKDKKSIDEQTFLAPSKSTAGVGAKKKNVTLSLPKNKSQKNAKNQKFEYGNYNRYYGYRNPGTGVFPSAMEDSRLFHLRPEWFFGKDVLDIGCNVGLLTLEVARRFAPKSVLGIDIDPELIGTAKKFAENLKEYQVPISSVPTPVACLSAAATPSRISDSNACHDDTKSQKNRESLFPQCFPLIFGPLDPTGVVSDHGGGDQTPHPQQTPRTAANSGGPFNLFGRKVRFLCDNYVPESDELLDLAQQEFDTILCLSTTKWIHLNFGDEGIKRTFKRMYAQLRPGGILILEAQGYSSYCKKKKLTPRIFENFQRMKFLPEHFSDYLLHEVGFSTSHVVAVPTHSSKGFQRPIQVFTKMPQSSIRSLCETSSSQTTPQYCPSCGGGFSSCPPTPYSTHTTPYHSCPGSCQATPHYYHHYNIGSEGETPVHNSLL